MGSKRQPRGTAGEPAASEAALVAELNDLIQLDRDAVHAYSLAIAQTGDRRLRVRLIEFRGDHERHIRDLGVLVESYGGRPAPLPHIPTGLLKLGLQAAGFAGGDAGMLLSLQANESQAREKYARHAAASARRSPVVAEVLQRHAEDEAGHYAWVSDVLKRLGFGPETVLGASMQAVASVHGATADAIETAQRIAATAVEQALRGTLRL
jgi:demethoxyubiquinone hydroxylase (CLK1/Coq7/Cat5 family)